MPVRSSVPEEGEEDQAGDVQRREEGRDQRDDPGEGVLLVVRRREDQVLEEEPGEDGL
jgi:hypothetical protein